MAEATPKFSGRMLARLLGVTEARVSQMAKEGIIERLPNKQGYSAKCITQYCEWLRSRRFIDVESSSKDKYGTAKERKLLADAILAEMEVAKEKKQLVTLEAIDAEHERFVMEIKTALLNLPKKISPMLIGVESIPEISTILEHEMDEALRSLARMGE